MEKAQFYEFLRKIPKAELHLHSEAIISRETVSEILSITDQKYKDKNVVDKLFTYNNLKEFISVFLLIQTAFKKISDFEKLFSNISPYLKRNGIVYAELFFAPSNFIRNGIEFKDMINVLMKEIDKIKKKEKIDIKIIIDVSRTFGIENAQNNLDALIKCKCDNIIGIGLGGDEKKGPAIKFEKVFKKAKTFNFHRVAHAGEDDGPKSIWDAINFLDAERIGHGIAAIKDDKLIDYLVEKQIPLEICPTSNVFTGKYVKKIKEHPIKPFFKRGVLVTLNTDDPAFFNVQLLDEYWNLHSKLNFSMDDIRKIIINGFKASFISEKRKNEYIKKVNSAWEKYH
ncbi:MAG: adenosine deaminase [Spirochaetes bacterium]|nr:adenosine deaminase [Spirochaetota bacterium]